MVEDRLVQRGEVILGFGNSARLKAQLRQQHIRDFQALTPLEKLERVLELTQRKEPDESR
jgi:hypothetical protein